MDCPLTLIVNLCILSRHYAQDRISYPRCTICNGAIFFLHIKIEEEWLIFSCYVLGIKLFQRKVQAESIKQILLIKNERQTIVLVQITNSIRLKLQRFKPITYIEEIQQFAERNALPLKEQSLLKQGK